MVKFSIEKNIAEISTTDHTKKLLTVTSWDGKPAKLDLRVWREIDDPAVPGQKAKVPTKGVTLDMAEAAALLEALAAYLQGSV